MNRPAGNESKCNASNERYRPHSSYAPKSLGRPVRSIVERPSPLLMVERYRPNLSVGKAMMPSPMDLIGDEDSDQARRGVFPLLDQLDFVRQDVALPQVFVGGDQPDAGARFFQLLVGQDYPGGRVPPADALARYVMRRCADEDLLPTTSRPGGYTHREGNSVGSPLWLNSPTRGEQPISSAGSIPPSPVPDIWTASLEGPTLPNMTFWLLPRSRPSDGEIAMSVSMLQYCWNPSCVIILMVSTVAPHPLCTLMEDARRLDPDGLRTVVVCDNLGAQPSAESAETAPATSPSHGWSWWPPDFAGWEHQGSWRPPVFVVPPRSRGADPRFRSGLETWVVHLTMAVMPHLSHRVEDELADCRYILTRLGPSQASQAERAAYLGRVGDEFCAALAASVDGTPHRYFDQTIPARSRVVRLRKLVGVQCRTLRNALMAAMRDTRELGASDLDWDAAADQDRTHELFVRRVEAWPDLLQNFLDSIWRVSDSAVKDLLAHMTDVETGRQIQQRVLQGCMDGLRQSFYGMAAVQLPGSYRTAASGSRRARYDQLRQEWRQRQLRTSLAWKLNKYFEIEPPNEAGFSHEATVDVRHLLDYLMRGLEPAELDLRRQLDLYSQATVENVDRVFTLMVENSLLKQLQPTLKEQMSTLGQRDDISGPLHQEGHYTQALRSFTQSRQAKLAAAREILNGWLAANDLP